MLLSKAVEYLLVNLYKIFYNHLKILMLTDGQPLGIHCNSIMSMLGIVYICTYLAVIQSTAWNMILD